MNSSGIQNNNKVLVIFTRIVILLITVAVIQLLWIFKDITAFS